MARNNQGPPTKDQANRSQGGHLAWLCKARYTDSHGVSSSNRRRIGVHGGRAPPAPGRPFRDRGRPRHRRFQRRGAGGRPLSQPRGGVPRPRLPPLRAGRPRRHRRGLPGAAPRPVAAPRRGPRRPGLPPRRHRRRLPPPGRRLRAVVRRGPRGARADRPVRLRSPRAVPEGHRRLGPRRQPRLLPDGGVAGPGAPSGRRPRRAGRPHRRRRLRRLRAGAGGCRPRASTARPTRTSPPTAS